MLAGNIQAYVLAGGKSSRMQEDKGLKLLNGKPMVKYVLDIITPFFSCVKINTSNSDYAFLGYKLISDDIPEKGPMGGIHTALKDSRTENIFIVSCDMPFINYKSVKYLLQENINLAKVISNKGIIQPLFGIYNKKLISILEEKINTNQLKMTECIKEIGSEIVEMDFLDEENTFININTVEEFRNSEKKTIKNEN